MPGSMYYFKLVSSKISWFYHMKYLDEKYRPSAMPKAQKDVLADASNSTSSGAVDSATATGTSMSGENSATASIPGNF